jgi:hypothetical protein
MKEGPLTLPVAKTTPSVAKQKPAPKPVPKAVEGLEKPSAKPAQANETFCIAVLLALLAILTLYLLDLQSKAIQFLSRICLSVLMLK